MKNKDNEWQKKQAKIIIGTFLELTNSEALYEIKVKVNKNA